LTLLLGGSQYQRYRVETALETLVALRADGEDVRLIVTGNLSFAADAGDQVRQLVHRLNLNGAVELTGPYTQAVAPQLYRRADVLLHTKVADPCPTLVLEAMAVGLPVVYAASGGTPELVGEDAGIGVPALLDWQRDHPPAPSRLAEAVRGIAARLDDYAAAARERSALFDMERWVARHCEVFEELVVQ
jgi:glycosyltransferase involved in cell wall biosynthesis